MYVDGTFNHDYEKSLTCMTLYVHGTYMVCTQSAINMYVHCSDVYVHVYTFTYTF
jgi:hypothetical protein